jgi:HEAT repeat protein
MFAGVVAVWTLTGALAARLEAQTAPEPAEDAKRLDNWLQRLKSPDAKERRRAAEAIGSWAAQARSAVPRLAARMRTEKDVETLKAIASALVAARDAAVPSLTGLLWDENTDLRFLAAYCLAQIGAPARPAVPSLLQRLKGGDGPTRDIAVRALAAIGAREAVPELVPLLGDKDPDVGTAALQALTELGAEARLLVPPVIERLRDKSVVARQGAVTVLFNLGREAKPAIAGLVKALGDDDPEVRRGAALALGRIGPAAQEATPALVAVMNGDSPAFVRLAAAEALWRIERHKEVAPALKSWLKNQSGPPTVPMAQWLWRVEKDPGALAVLREVVEKKRSGDRGAALEALIQIGPKASPTLPAVAVLLKDEDPGLRAAAANLLARVGETAGPLAPPLSDALREKDAAVRLALLHARWHVLKDRQVIPRLAELLKDKDTAVREAAGWTLEAIGPDAREAVAALEATFGDPQGTVRVAAASAAWRIAKPPAALAALISTLKDEDAASRDAAAIQLGYALREQAGPAVPALVQALWDEDTRVRSSAAEALGRIGSPARPAIPALIAMLQGPGQPDFLYSSASEALGLMGPAARAAVGVLREKLKHPDSYVRVNAAKALWLIDRSRSGEDAAMVGLEDRNDRARLCAAETLWLMQQHPQSIPTLIELLSEPGPKAANGRYMAARALGRIGAPARAATAALLEASNDVEAPLRETALEALKRIDPEAARKAAVR